MYETREQREAREQEKRFNQFPYLRREHEAKLKKEAEKAAAEKAASALKAKTNEAKRAFNAAARESTNNVKAFYSQPLDVMGQTPVDQAPTDYIRPLGREFTVRTSPRDHKNEAKIYWAFRNALAAERGTTLSEEGWIRLGSWVSALLENADIQSSADVWEEGLHRLQSLGCFGNEIADYVERPAQVLPPMPVVEPVDTRSFDDKLESIDTSTRQGGRDAKSLVIQDIYGEIRAAYKEFAADCSELFFGAEFETAEIEAMAQIAQSRSLNVHTPKGWHEARRVCVRAGQVRELFLLPDEALAWKFDKGQFDMNTIDGRNTFYRERAAVVAKGTIQR